MSAVPDVDGEVQELAKRREAEADDLLDMPWWKPWLWFRRPWDSESRKSLARIKTSLQTARELHRTDGLGSQEARLLHLLEPSLRQRSLDSLIETVYALDEALVATGDEDFLLRRHAAETLADGDETTLPAVEEQLRRSAGADDVGDPRCRAAAGNGPSAPREADWAAMQRALSTLYEVRRFRYRRQRARRRMKTAVLLLAGAILLALVIALALVVRHGLDGNPSLVLLTAVGGALGGTLANLFRLRDELSRGTELRAFKPMLVAQPAVGAASGLVLLLIVEGGFFGITEQPGGTRWATITVLAFAAGLSEALFVGIVRKAAGAVSRDAPTAGAGGRSKGA